MSRPASLVIAFFVFMASASLQAEESRYVVVSLVEKGDPYEQAGVTLEKLRNASTLRASVKDLDSLLPRLKEAQPDYVAFIARPEQIDVNLARQIFQLATQIDDDPFVDFAYGVITGRTPKDAIRLAQSGAKVESKKKKPELGILGVADNGFLKKSQSQQQHVPLSGLVLPMTWATIAAEKDNPDQDFLKQTLKQFQSKSLFAFAGHGYPDGVVGGPKHNDLQGRDFSGAVVYNIACYTGVTSNWYQNDFQTSKIKQEKVTAGESFCLSMLETGVAGYVAYACPRPAGPEMFADMLSMATEGISTGEQRRRHANRVILTHLGQDVAETGFELLQDGQPIKPAKSTDEIVRNMSTGGLLFGDPATMPFQETDGAYPIASDVRKQESGIRVDVEINGPLWHWFCADQLEQAFMKIETRVEVSSSGIKSVTVDRLPFGKKYPAKKVTAATETHDGKTYLHVKAAFERPEQSDMMRFGQGVEAQFSVEWDSANGSNVYTHAAGDTQ